MTPPVVAIEAPVDGAIATGIVDVQITATDAGGIREVQLWVDGRMEATATEPNGPGIDEYSLAVDTLEMDNGRVALVAVAVDLAGNWDATEFVIVDVRNELSPEITTTAFALETPVPLDDVLSAANDAGLGVVELIHERQGILEAEPSQSLLADLEGLPVAAPNQETITGHFWARGLSTEQISASYLSMYQEQVPGGEPQIVAFRVDQTVEPSDLGALGANVASSAQMDLSTPLTPNAAEPEMESINETLEASAADNEVTGFWPTHGELNVTEEIRTETILMPLDPFFIDVEVEKAIIENFLVWSPEARENLVPGRAYEHDIKNFSPGRSGIRPLCNPLDPGDFYLAGSGQMFEHNAPAATNPYLDWADFLDECDRTDVSFGLLNPEELGAGLPPEVWAIVTAVYETELLNGPDRTFHIIAESHTKQGSLPGTPPCEEWPIWLQPASPWSSSTPNPLPLPISRTNFVSIGTRFLTR